MRKTDKMTAREQVLIDGMLALLRYNNGEITENEEAPAVTYDARYNKKLLKELDETLVFMSCQTRKFYEQEDSRLRLLDEVRKYTR